MSLKTFKNYSYYDINEILTSSEINNYVNDYLNMSEEKRNNSFTEKMSSKLNHNSSKVEIEFPEYLGHS